MAAPPGSLHSATTSERPQRALIHKLDTVETFHEPRTLAPEGVSDDTYKTNCRLHPTVRFNPA
jgi:hypothetical protein